MRRTRSTVFGNKIYALFVLQGTSGGKQIPQRILAGSTTAFIAVALFQPTEVVKIRMQAQNRAAKSERMYSGSLQAYRSVVGFISALFSKFLVLENIIVIENIKAHPVFPCSVKCYLYLSAGC